MTKTERRSRSRWEWTPLLLLSGPIAVAFVQQGRQSDSTNAPKRLTNRSVIQTQPAQGQAAAVNLPDDVFSKTGKANSTSREEELPLDEEARKALREMEPEEREFCLETLSRITATSTLDDVVRLLGPPSRNLLNSKLNWWVKLGQYRSRVGVFFHSGNASQIVLDGGYGRFYYTYRPGGSEQRKPNSR